MLDYFFFYTQPEAEGFTVDHYRWVTAATVSFCPTAQMASAGTLWTNHHLALLIYSTGYYRFAGGCRNHAAYTWIIKDDKKNSVKGNPNLRLRFCFFLIDESKIDCCCLREQSYKTFILDVYCRSCFGINSNMYLTQTDECFCKNWFMCLYRTYGLRMFKIKESCSPTDKKKKKWCTHLHVVPNPYE